MYKLTVISDIHYYSEKLGTVGHAYDVRSSEDQKCLAESGAITDAAFEEIGNSDCDAVLIAGDLSNDGEKVCHEEFRDKLRKLNRKKPVYVIYATHDWCCDGNPRRFIGNFAYNDVETMTPSGLREFYKSYGLNRAYSEYVTHLGASSYAVKLTDGIRLICLNDDQDGKGHSGYSDSHLEWILTQVKDAKANGESVIIMEHHLVLPNLSPLISGGMTIGDREDRAEALADAGVDFLIVGHSHMQRTTQYTAKNGNVMTQINVGSLTGYPAPINHLTFDGDECKMDVEFLDKFTYNGTEYDNSYLKNHTAGVIRGILESAAYNKTDFVDRITSFGPDKKTAEKLYYPVHLIAKKVLDMSVGKAAKLINGLTFGRGIDKYAVECIYNDNLFNHITEIFLSVFDGSYKKYDYTDPVFSIAHDVGTLPGRVFSKLPLKEEKKKSVKKTLSQIEDIVTELTKPSEPDNLHAVFTLK